VNAFRSLVLLTIAGLALAGIGCRSDCACKKTAGPRIEEYPVPPPAPLRSSIVLPNLHEFSRGQALSFRRDQYEPIGDNS